MSFYDKLQPIEEFEHIHNLELFAEAPADWMVMLSDIRGSTQAVQQGRAKDVNMLGASVITLVANGTGSYNTISVFGGDGATLLISTEDFQRLRPQFVGLMRLAKEKFAIDLRVGAVPVSVLNKQGHKVLVGKYRISGTTDLAQFLGSGITQAENMVKNKAPGAEVLSLDEAWTPPELNGLSCRLNRFPNKNGKVLSLIVKGRTETDSTWIRQTLVPQIKEILGGDFQAGNPIKQSALKWNWIPSTMSTEIKLNAQRSPFAVLFWTLFANLLLKFNISIGGFVPGKYKTEVSLQSDFKKYDDALRMVIDCSPAQADAVRKILEGSLKQGHIYYGVHESEGAVVTCFTRIASAGQHVHFVDGEGCGYSMASIQMKAQMKGEG